MIDEVGRVIETEIEICVPPERVWRAWTEGDEMVAWWGEDGLYRVTKWTGDVRPGGMWRAEGDEQEGKPFYVEGRYLRVEPPHLLSFTWRHDWSGPASDTVVTIELHPTADGTRLKLRHSGFGTDEARNSHAAGWNRVLGWLRNYLASDSKS